ncbi:MAG: hemolysin family protein, partial [Candidatus Limnocylindria bacterium]
DTPLPEIVRLMSDQGHSRIPVYRGSLDEIEGMVHIKDVLGCLHREQPARLRDIVRRALFVAPSMPILELLLQMRVTRIHLALVVDEFGGIDGLATIEDLVEEIVGEIQDEYDVEESLIEPIETDGDRRAYRLDGRVTMDDLRDLFELGDAEEPDEEAYDTVGGLIIHRVGRIPLVGTEINYREVTLRVQAADSRRVSKVMAVQMLESPAAVENSSR